MARYFFDYSVGDSIARDSEGAVCCDDKAAVRHAWTKLADMLAAHGGILPWQHFELVVRREDGLHVASLGMTVVVESLNPASAAAHALQKAESERLSWPG